MDKPVEVGKPSLIQINVNTEALGKAAEKLVSTVAAGLGAVYEPIHVVRMAKAKKEAAMIELGGDLERQALQRRTLARWAQQETRRQQNLEAVVNEAVGYLPASVSEAPVAPDWTARFFEGCQDVSEEELRTIWARLLAGEVAQPRSFSRRTISILRDMSPEDAGLFRRLCRLLWESGEGPWVPRDLGHVALSDFGLDLNACVHLNTLGLIVDAQWLQVLMPPEGTLVYGGRRYGYATTRILPPEPRVARVEAMVLTASGEELRKVCDAPPDPEFLLAALRGLVEGDGLRIWSPLDP